MRAVVKAPAPNTVLAETPRQPPAVPGGQGWGHPDRSGGGVGGEQSRRMRAPSSPPLQSPGSISRSIALLYTPSAQRPSGHLPPNHLPTPSRFVLHISELSSRTSQSFQRSALSLFPAGGKKTDLSFQGCVQDRRSPGCWRQRGAESR